LNGENFEKVHILDGVRGDAAPDETIFVRSNGDAVILCIHDITITRDFLSFDDLSTASVIIQGGQYRK
jgi:hypothetical protein